MQKLKSRKLERGGIYHSILWNGAWGWQGLLYSDRGINKFVFGEKSECAAGKNLLEGAGNGIMVNDTKKPPCDIEKAREQIDRYFSGERVEFDMAVDTRGCGEFARGVWEAAKRIPYGEVRTYGEVARECGAPAAARAVGRALGANPLPVIIPCHRVVRSGGGLGGFSRGIEWKRRLLELEGIKPD